MYISKGGLNNGRNILPLCKSCHKLIHSEEAFLSWIEGMWLLKIDDKYIPPRTLQSIVRRLYCIDSLRKVNKGNIIETYKDIRLLVCNEKWFELTKDIPINQNIYIPVS